MRLLSGVVTAILLLPVTGLAGYEVDVQLPTTNTIVSVPIDINGTGFKDFDDHVDVNNGTQRGLGFRIRVTNFVVRADGVALTFKAEHATLSGWQSIQMGPTTIKTPIVKSSSASAALQRIAINTWTHAGVFPNPMTGNKPAMIRVRNGDSQQTPAGDVLKASPEE